MDCIICVKPFIPEKEFGNYHRNLEMCASAISKLFRISRNPNVQGVLEDLVICVGCHQKLENVMDLLTQFDELQRKIDEKRIAIQNQMVDSNEVSQAMSKNFDNRLSKSSLDRLTLLKAITGNTPPPGSDEGKLDTCTGDSSESEEEQVQATDDSESEDSFGSANERDGVHLTGAMMLKNVKICLERVQLRPGVSTVNIKSIVPSNSKGGHTLRNPRPSAKPTTRVGESSDEDFGSDSASGDDSSSVDDTKVKTKASISSKISVKMGQRVNKQPRRTYGSLAKEFTRLKNGSFQCKRCSKILTNKRGKGKHLSIHGPRNFKCSVKDCGKRFYRKSHLDNHVKIVHEKRRDFKCTWTGCGKGFGEKGTLNLHVKVVHEKRQDFKCTVPGCGKRFGQKFRMIIHVKTVHEGRKDLMCPWHGCDKWFGVIGSLTRHIKVIHEGWRPCKCKVEGCGKVFGSNQDLFRHMSSKHKRMRVAKKKSVKSARVRSPQALVRPNLKLEIFECRMSLSCRNVYGLEWERDAHEESHSLI